MKDEKEVCSVCSGNDYVYVEGILEQCPLCTALGKLYEAEGIKNETRTETISTHH